jgi:hypothetical protein
VVPCRKKQKKKRKKNGQKNLRLIPNVSKEEDEEKHFLVSEYQKRKRIQRQKK